MRAARRVSAAACSPRRLANSAASRTKVRLTASADRRGRSMRSGRALAKRPLKPLNRSRKPARWARGEWRASWRARPAVLQRALVDRAAHALSERLRRAVEALAWARDDRLAPWQGASERAQVAAQIDGRSAGSRRVGAPRVPRSSREGRRGQGSRIRPQRSASARAGPPHDRSGSSRSRGRRRR